VLVVAVLAGGFLLGKVAGSGSRAAVEGRTEAVKPARAKVPPADVPLLAPLPPRVQPVTGPHRTPLPLERGGPYGSRFTTGTAEVALTFDDGPHPQWTPLVLALLREYGVKATFCMIGVNAARYPRLVSEVAADGHTLCNHSWAHDLRLGLRDEETIVADLRRANDALTAAAPSARISYFRQPGGNWSATVVAAARRLGMTSLHWRVDPRDWRNLQAQRIATDVTTRTTPGAIVLLHDGGGDRGGTLAALRTILPNLGARFHLAALPPGMAEPRAFRFDRPEHPGHR
jgi:peptidoglycan/xylan/chitin deacetylase (PgdA/CDA1 family)